jgi:hypothetical protein
MGHTLFVMSLVKLKLVILFFQRLSETHNAPMAENADDAFHEFDLCIINRDILAIEKFYQGLCHCESDGFHE